MAVVVYKCTVCNRMIERLLQPTKPDVFGRCIITNGCKGTLYRVDYKPRIIATKLPDPVPGLQDWVQRQAFFEYKQPYKSTEWKIAHNLNNTPVVVVYVKDDTTGKYQTLDRESFKVEYNDLYSLTIRFDREYKGLANLIVVETREEQQVQSEEQSVETIAFAPSKTITFAIRDSIIPANTQTIPIDVKVFSSATSEQIALINETIGIHKYLSNSNSPFSLYKEAIINASNYTIASVTIDDYIQPGNGLQFDLPPFPSIDVNDVIILTASDPFSYVDISLQDVIYFNSLKTASQSVFDVFVDGKDVLHVKTSFISTLFPPFIVR